jgi:uncharacterized DUF497 family protein
VAKLHAFEWDAGNLTKCQKHGVSAAEMEALFASDPRVGRDEKHSEAEDRYVAIGRNRAGRPIFVVFTLRLIGGRELVRPVSARYMHRKEIERYEQKIAADKD